MEPNAVVKRMLGNAWNARNPKAVIDWVQENLQYIPEQYKKPFLEVALNDRSAHEVADEMGLVWDTVRGRVSAAFQHLGTLARAMPKSRFNRLFQSVFDHKFGDEVRTSELTLALFGRYDRRSTQAIAVKWIPKVEAGQLDLPMPQKKGKFWVWTREQAEEWRRWFAGDGADGDELDAR